MFDISGTKLDVRAYPIKEPKGKTVAFASVTINDMIGINGIQIVDGKNGLFAQMPQTKDTNGSYRDIAFPVTRELRLQLNSAVIDAYHAEIDKQSVKEQLKDGQKADKATPSTTKDKGTKAKTTKKTSEPEH